MTEDLKDREDELEQLRDLIAQKDLEIETLSREAGCSPPDFIDPSREKTTPIPKSQLYYRPIMGDLVDENLSALVNAEKCIVPICRLVDNYYLFGTIKVQLKMVDGVLVAKVGHSTVSFEEFLRVKSEGELAKIEELS